MACCRAAVLAPIIFAAGALHSTAWALGLGDIEVRSALNQPLDASIDLLAVRSEDALRINVRLADEVAFLTSGVDRAPLLNQLIFSIEQTSSGTAFVKVSTREAVKEPFLDFIVEVNWPSGRLLREYTVLLDPPTFVGEAEAAVAAPTTVAPKAPVPISAAPRASVSAGKAAGAGDSGARSSSGMSAGATAGEPRGNGDASGGKYGPVAPNESLRSIAEKVGPGGDISAEQTMMALFEANPDAFFDGNINNLKAGQVLRVPDTAKIAQVNKTEAGRIAREHYSRWIQSRRTKSATSTEKVRSTAGLAAMADGSAPTPAATDAEASGQLRLFSPDAKEAAGLGGEAGKEAGGKGAGTDEIANLEASELRTQVSALKEQLATMERLITLKDDALVELQRKLSGDPSMPSVATAEPAASPGANEEAVAPKAADVSAAATEETSAPPVAPRKAPGAGVDQAEETNADDLPSVLLEPRMLAMILGVVLLVSAVVWTLIRRRRAAQEEVYEMPMSEQPVSIRIPNSNELGARGFQAGAAAAAASAAADAAEETMDFNAGGLETLETDESDIDPIAEADVYLAYRRFQQAEALIKDALAREPDRPDLQLKLLEIYFGSGNKTSFESQAEALYAQVGSDAEIWSKVQEMGQELCPDHPLFGGGATMASSSLDEAASHFNAHSDQAAPLFENNPFAEPALEESEPLWRQPAAQPNTSARAQSDLMDFGAEKRGGDGDDFSLKFQSGPRNRADADFDAKDSVALNAASGEGGMDFDLSGFNFDKPTPLGGSMRADASGGAQPARNQSELELDSALSAMSSRGSSEVEEVFTGLDDVDLGGDGGDLFSGADMIGTKLDLARAYIDMDDRDGARGILKEVLEEGSDTQRQEATELMRKLGS